MSVPSGYTPTEFVYDTQLRQVQNIRALQPINGPQLVGVDDSKTSPQVDAFPSPLDGELPRPPTLGNDYYKKARMMRRDPTIRLVRELSMAPILMAEWEYEAEDDAPEGAKEFIEKIMNEMRLPVLRTILCGLCDYGWQSFEIIGEPRKDGFEGIRLKPLLPDITAILVNAADGSFFGLRQTPMVGLRIGWIYLLDEECFVISQDVEGTNWYGEPTLRACEKVYDEAEAIMKAARKYDVKIAGTHWVIYYPLGISKWKGVDTDNGQIAKELLQSAEAVGGIMVPRSVIQATDTLNAAQANSEAAQWKIELLSDSGKGVTPFTERLTYLDKLKVRAFGYPERSVLEGQFGTKAEAETHGDVAVSNVEVRHSLVCTQINSKIVSRLLRWNYGPSAEGTVRIKPSPLADSTLAFFREVYKLLLANPQSFMQELSSLDTHAVRERLGLPEVPPMAYDPFAADNVQPMLDENGMLVYDPPQDGAPLPATFDLYSDVEDAAARAADPSKAQREAGNYRKGKIRLHGLPISIETARGQSRHGNEQAAHYGYVNGTIGADGDQVDVFIGKHPYSEIAFVVNAVDESGKFDEHKVLLGFKNEKKALRAYKDSYPKRWRVGECVPMTIPRLREWLSSGKTKRSITA